LLLTAFPLLIASCDDEETGNCEPSTASHGYFIADATDLALDHLYATGDPDTAEVLVSREHVDHYIQALGLIYDSQLPQRDSIVEKQLHVETSATAGIVVRAIGAEWMENWVTGVMPTGNAILDEMIEEYDLHVIQALNGDALVTSGFAPVNARALAYRFKQLPDVQFSEPNITWNNFSKIECTFDGNLAHVIFYEGWGDCFAGCAGYHRWEFDADLSGCSATFTGYYP